MDKVSIEIDSRRVKVARSPASFTTATLEGISVSFAPLFVYWSGRGNDFNGLEWLVVPRVLASFLLSHCSISGWAAR
jgi:hypothetical protein